MSTDVAEPASRHAVSALVLVWQNPHTRRFSKVARLEEVGGRFRFEYLADAKDPAFEPIHSFPRLDQVYETAQLPAFFKNRVMSRKRSSFAEYAGWLGLDPAMDAPLEILARPGGARATDTFYVVEEPQLRSGERTVIRFFASGLSHVDGALGRLLMVRAGDKLLVRPEPTNPVNARALLIDAAAGEAVGWIPDWLLDEVHELMTGEQFNLCVERINFDAPWHLKLLCRLEAICA